MARFVKRFRNEPYTLVVAGESVSICGCGLSAKLPYCDGSHILAATETVATMCWYDVGGNRHDATDAFPTMRSDDQGPRAPR